MGLFGYDAEHPYEHKEGMSFLKTGSGRTWEDFWETVYNQDNWINDESNELGENVECIECWVLHLKWLIFVQKKRMNSNSVS